MLFHHKLVEGLSRVQDSTSEGATSLQDVVHLSNAGGCSLSGLQSFEFHDDRSGRTHEVNGDMSVD